MCCGTDGAADCLSLSVLIIAVDCLSLSVLTIAAVCFSLSIHIAAVCLSLYGNPTFREQIKNT